MKWGTCCQEYFGIHLHFDLYISISISIYEWAFDDVPTPLGLLGVVEDGWMILWVSTTEGGRHCPELVWIKLYFDLYIEYWNEDGNILRLSF